MLAEIGTETAKGVQRRFALLYGTRGTISWDFYSETDRKILDEKIKLLIPNVGSPNIDEYVRVSKDRRISAEFRSTLLKTISKWEKENEKLIKLRCDLLNAIWSQRKYCDGKLLMTIFFVVLTPVDETILQYNLSKAKESRKFSCHPIFRIRKCTNNNDSEGRCMVFVGEYCRVYKDWEDFKENNTFPEGILVTPKKGIYSNCHDEVELECFKTREATLPVKALKITDSIASASALVGGGIMLTALCAPISAVAIGASIVLSSISGGYGIVRSSVNLADRGNHEQTINVTDREARSSWLGIATGALGVASVGATQAVKIISTGTTISMATKVATNGINIAAMTANGAGIANGVYDISMKIHNNEPVTLMECLQVSTSFVLFTHSLYNFRIISEIKTTSNKSFMESLNKPNEFFQNLRAQSINFKNFLQTKFDGIRGVNTIPDYPQYFFADGSNINVNINDVSSFVNILSNFAHSPATEIVVKTILRKIGRKAMDKLVSILQELIEKYRHKFREIENYLFSDRLLLTLYNVALNAFGVFNIAHKILNTKPEDIVELILNHYDGIINSIITIIADISSSSMPINSLTDLKFCLINIFENLSVKAANKLIALAKMYFEANQDYIQNMIKRCLTFENFLWDVFNVSCSFAGTIENLNETILSINANEIQTRIRNFYKKFEIRAIKEYKCGKCKGYYSIKNNI